MDHDEIMTLQLICVQQRDRQIRAVAKAVDKLLYETIMDAAPEGIFPARWVAMINHVLKNGLPCSVRYVRSQ